MSDFNEERLGKIVALARGGAKGEKQNAQAILKKLCKKYGLDYKEVLHADETVKEFYLDHTKAEKPLAVQVVCRYAHRSMDDDTWNSYDGQRIFFKTTKEKYIETLNAWEVLRKLYAKEKKLMAQAFFMGFLQKHWLYYRPTPEEVEKHHRRVLKSKKEESEEEKRARELGEMIAEGLEDAEIMKRLGSG